MLDFVTLYYKNEFFLIFWHRTGIRKSASNHDTKRLVGRSFEPGTKLGFNREYLILRSGSKLGVFMNTREG